MTDAATRFVERFATICNTTVPKWSLVDKAGEQFLSIQVGKINDIYADALVAVRKELSEKNENGYATRVFLKAVTPRFWLNSIEVQLLQRIITESLTIGKTTLDSAFHKKFIPFLGGEERKIYSAANHVVFGRRGAGKSSLILYACHQTQRAGIPYAWIALQQYSGRTDLQIIPQVLYEIIEAMSIYPNIDAVRIQRLRDLINLLEEKGEKLTKMEINQKLPIFARDFVPLVKIYRHFYLFLDDLHLLHPTIQPYFLSALYSFARGNSIHLKITSIENLTTLLHEGEKEGLQTPGDAQVIRLDYNLVNPETAMNHIREIIYSYVKYVGIPSIKSIIGQKVIERLVWVAAGVPRDALYIFNNAITKALANNRKKITITDINMTAADSLTEKERSVSDDVAEDSALVKNVVDDIKDYCLKEIRCNAFLVRLDSSNERYRLLKKISDLRFIHIVHPGITPTTAGEKYEAYMLDYAFYTGFRKAPSVKEFISGPQQIMAKNLRKLQRYRYDQRQVFTNLSVSR